MKALVIYDSLYGNTKLVAEAIGTGIGDGARVLPIAEASGPELESLDLLVVGAPTHGGKASPPMQKFLKNLPQSAIAGVDVAAFDTRMTTKWVKIFGYAAGKIGKALAKKGGNLLLKAEPFWVTGGKGPLKEGELERAADWAKQVVDSKG